MTDTELTSPESVTFTYDIAGPGSRFAALLVDVTVQLLLLFALWVVASGGLYLDLAIYSPSHARSLGLSMWLWTLVVLLTFVILWGYFVFFEMTWNGQTPGKRLFGLRVMRAGGYPVDLLASSVRNLVRYVDFLPGTYSVGVITMFLSRQWQRLGDYAAGTLVVRNRRLTTPEAFTIQAPPRWAEALAQIEAVTSDEYRVVREFLRRRGELDQASRARLAERIALPLAERLGAALAQRTEEQEGFLEAVAGAYRQRYG